MKRKEYLKPEMKVFQLQSKSQLLVGSISTTKTMQIYDDEDEAVYEQDIL